MGRASCQIIFALMQIFIREQAVRAAVNTGVPGAGKTVAGERRAADDQRLVFTERTPRILLSIFAALMMFSTSSLERPARPSWMV